MYKKGEEMSKEEAVQLLTAAGYKAKVENSVVIARVENFTKKEFEKVRSINRLQSDGNTEDQHLQLHLQSVS